MRARHRPRRRRRRRRRRTYTFSSTLPAAYQWSGNYLRIYQLAYNAAITGGAQAAIIAIDGNSAGVPGRVRITLPALAANVNLAATRGYRSTKEARINANILIEIIGLLVGGGGGGVAIARLTRLAVAVETMAERIAAVAGDVAKTGQQVQDHENRLNKGGL